MNLCHFRNAFLSLMLIQCQADNEVGRGLDGHRSMFCLCFVLIKSCQTRFSKWVILASCHYLILRGRYADMQ